MLWRYDLISYSLYVYFMMFMLSNMLEQQCTDCLLVRCNYEIKSIGLFSFSKIMQNLGVHTWFDFTDRSCWDLICAAFYIFLAAGSDNWRDILLWELMGLTPQAVVNIHHAYWQRRKDETCLDMTTWLEILPAATNSTWESLWIGDLRIGERECAMLSGY